MKVSIALSAQQIDVVRAVAERRGESIDSLAVRALTAMPEPRQGGSPDDDAARRRPPPSGHDAASILVEPGTGAGLVVRRGEVLRVEQVAGDQGVDVELFALRDRRLRLDAGRTRSLEGIRPRLGTTLWSAPPDELALATLVTDTAPGHDLLYPACSMREYERATGCAGHASCRSIELAVATAWGLDERDLHDPLNLWLEAGVKPDGALWWRHTRTGPGDHAELLARADLLAIVNPCANDLFGGHRFDVRAVRVGVRPASEAERGRWSPDPGPAPAPDAIRRLPGVEPRFDLAPLARAALDVELPDRAAPALARLRESGEFGDADGDVLRAALFRWWGVAEAGGVPFAREDPGC